ncbi:MAG: Tn3 family transposase [Bacteroidota bacterium]
MMDLLGFEFSPIIAKIHEQRLYSFETIAVYKQKGYPILPSAYVQQNKIKDNWQEILRLVCSLKLKYALPSEIFTRFNSYSRQHPLYQALKEYGRMIKTLHILNYIDQLELRQEAKFMQTYAENNNKFNKAIAFNNGGDLIFLTRQEQLMAEACKNLIKNAIICWNYLYLTRLVQQEKTPQRKQEMIELIKQASLLKWAHISFNGQYDFSEQFLTDSFDLINPNGYKLNLA